MMQVVGVSTVYPGPGSPVSGLFVQRRLAALRALAEVRVIHPRPWFPVLRPCPATWLRSIPDEVVPVTSRRMFYLPGLLKSLDGRWLQRAVLPPLRHWAAMGQVDVIDAQFGYPEGVGCVLAGRALGKPVFITMHGLEAWILTQGRRGAQLRWALRECAGVISVSESLRKVVLADGVPAEKVRVIRNAVGQEVFHPEPQLQARRRLGLGDTGRLLVSVGRFDHEKGHHVLLRAFRLVRARSPDLRLALIGERAPHEPKYLDSIQALIAALGLADVVLLPGPQPPDRVAAWLNAADLFALATFHEACCCAVLEAMACGQPVVTTPVGDNPLLVDPPQRGLLVPPGDEALLAEALAEALVLPWDRDRIAAWGQDYGWNSVAQATWQFFQERLDARAEEGRIGSRI